jgi:hypothetical protein
MSNLHQMVEDFTDKWGPNRPVAYQKFLYDLRLLLEAYGKAALAHESLPDTEHEHGEPV